ncbi:hypothetical protein [Mesorhizobium sp. B2-1-3A]|uniref:hypothetical protein n=1 Tax=Mesorhizobium sp. B2-1-3A TaxID=2589971 RepID=UPI0011267318|nr:hypothetical protein [Mesorhizobium sp. B2-1-3A]TPM89854.1 hypothetical protein FJ977_35335 [Mesorhizobium sp. B2-1-3A]
MSNVISFTKPEPCIWVCDCGCSTFKVYGDQHLECAQCGVTASAEGEWVREPVPEQARGPERVEQVTTMTSSADWTLRKLLKGTASPLVLVLAVEESGKATLWGADYKTPDQIGWLDRQFALARQILVRE